MPIRTFMMLTSREGRSFNENTGKDVERLLAADPSETMGPYDLFGLQLNGSKVCGIITGNWRKQTTLKTSPGAVAHLNHPFNIGDDCFRKRTGHPDLDAFLDYITEEVEAKSPA